MAEIEAMVTFSDRGWDGVKVGDTLTVKRVHVGDRGLFLRLDGDPTSPVDEPLATPPDEDNIPF